jgi:hypothetical protein
MEFFLSLLWHFRGCIIKYHSVVETYLYKSNFVLSFDKPVSNKRM